MTYYFPENWEHPIYFLDGENVFLTKKGRKHVTLPEFEISCEKSSTDDARKDVRRQALKLVVNLCIATSIHDGMVVMPVRNELIIQGPDEKVFIGCMHLGMALTHDDFPEEKHKNYDSWVPTHIWDVEEFEKNMEQMMCVESVMEE
jgi:hypothetical protein